VSDQSQVNGALEARVAELEQQLAALQVRRPAASSPMSRRRVAAFGIMLALLAVPGAVLARHQFSDVPEDHPFHADIDWMADYGIAGGFDDGTYRPANPVTRQAMAAFLHRLSNEFELVETTTDPPNGYQFDGYAACPDGKRAIAGGGHVGAAAAIFDSYPGVVSTPTGYADGWSVYWDMVHRNIAQQDPTYLTVWALCAPRL
jgi:S-layer homology domain